MSEQLWVWQFNEAVSMLREARPYCPVALREEIADGLIAMQEALEEAVKSPGGHLVEGGERVWYCGWKQATASPQDWMEATYEWHEGALHMVDQRMEDVLPWCPLCRMDGGLNLKPSDPRSCGWRFLIPLSTTETTK